MSLTHWVSLSLPFLCFMCPNRLLKFRPDWFQGDSSGRLRCLTDPWIRENGSYGEREWHFPLRGGIFEFLEANALGMRGLLSRLTYRREKKNQQLLKVSTKPDSTTKTGGLKCISVILNISFNGLINVGTFPSHISFVGKEQKLCMKKCILNFSIVSYLVDRKVFFFFNFNQ
ncbi:hypothetical protein CEXT_199071 [Caerostris extrusa]|uniref:Secreted protein n=1 Tax=Caerostris extrusa TaxID=172846 RepID=A0AAV4WU50_CAEEX|nr:hypothetical protein CEXT_199071 [Caerostris extrusa]